MFSHSLDPKRSLIPPIGESAARPGRFDAQQEDFGQVEYTSAGTVDSVDRMPTVSRSTAAPFLRPTFCAPDLRFARSSR